MTQPRQDKLIFLDLETTGLDPRDDKILEIGMIVTNQDFDILGTFSRVIKFDVLDNNGEENYIDDDVLEMHSENGLWDECKNGALITDVEDDVFDFLEDQDLVSGTQPMVGNSIGFDRAFLKVWMPDLEEFFHYRNLDVSSMTIFAERYLPDLYAGRPQGKAHRSIPDCMNSLEILKYYQQRLRIE